MSNRKMWTCRDGRKVRIKDMSDQHLLNTIKMLERAHRFIVDNVEGPNFNGEMAQMCAEQQFNAILASEPGDFYPIYLDLYEELDKRKAQARLVSAHPTYRDTPNPTTTEDCQ